MNKKWVLSLFSRVFRYMAQGKKKKLLENPPEPVDGCRNGSTITHLVGEGGKQPPLNLTHFGCLKCTWQSVDKTFSKQGLGKRSEGLTAEDLAILKLLKRPKENEKKSKKFY